MKLYAYIVIILSFFFTASCKKKPAGATPEVKVPPTVQQPVATKLGPFVPPADSLLTTKNLKAWSACNSLLDSLTYLYADSFKAKDVSLRIRYQDDFKTAQDRICLRTGLAGGYAEYKWILKSMGSSKNKSVLDSANIQSF